MKDIAVTYLGGSGFLVALGDIGLLFDASEHGADPRILPGREDLAAFRKLDVFVSHRHADHFSETIYDLCGESAVYIVGFDVPQPYRGVRMNPGDEQGFGPVNVRAFGSTDEGVSFLVTCAGVSLFHAGDLNLWHWRDESSIMEIEAAERAFYDCVAPIPKGEIDVAFLHDEWHWSRPKAVVVTTALLMFVGSFSALSFCPLADDKWMGRNFFDWVDYLTANISLPIGGLMVAVLSSWLMWDKVKPAISGANHEMRSATTYKVLRIGIAVFAPILVITVLMTGI